VRLATDIAGNPFTVFIVGFDVAVGDFSIDIVRQFEHGIIHRSTVDCVINGSHPAG
jgi:hypothetical protein